MFQQQTKPFARFDLCWFEQNSSAVWGGKMSNDIFAFWAGYPKPQQPKPRTPPVLVIAHNMYTLKDYILILSEFGLF